MAQKKYSYRARTKENKIVTGLIWAETMEAAKKVLIHNSLAPISVTVPHGFLDYLPFFGKVNLRDRSLFSRQLATMLDAGLTLAQAMRLLIYQSKNAKFRAVLESINQDLQDGFSFSSALAKYPEVFDTIYVSAIRAGEATGKLETVLEQLASNQETSVKLRGKIKGALFYPAFILVAMVGVAIVMMVQVIPQLTAVFTESDQKLPASTQLMIAMSTFLINRWYILIIVIAVMVLGTRMFLMSKEGIKLFSRFVLRVPVVGSIVEQANMGQMGRLLGMLLGSGVPLLEALHLLQASFNNKLYQNAIAQVAARVERGVPMSVPITENPLFPIMVGQMVAVGEQTGKMDEVMARMANYYEQEVETKVAGISSLIEPLIIVILGIGVAWLVIAILLPVYQISSAVN